MNLVFEISEGPTTGVSGITFIGNQAFGDARLRNVIETRESGMFGFLRSTDTYDQQRLSADEEQLRRFYLNHGYADFQVISSVADLDRERNTFFITFTVDEGPRYRFGQIFVDSTIPGVDVAELERLVHHRRRRRVLEPVRSRNLWRRSRFASPPPAFLSRRCGRASTAIPSA